MMAKRILVSIGTNERAEVIVPVVAALARDGGGTVRLLSVQPLQRTRFAETLERLRQLEPLLDGVAVERAVRFGDLVEEIVREAAAFDADLIAVTDRRRPWWRPALSRLVDRVRSRARVPVLMLSGAAR